MKVSGTEFLLMSSFLRLRICAHRKSYFRVLLKKICSGEIILIKCSLYLCFILAEKKQMHVCTVQFVFMLDILLNKEIKGPFKGPVI